MYGIGTTLVEAAHHRRDSLGIEYEPRWASLAAANLNLATTQGATGTVIRGDATRLPGLAPAAVHGQVGLVLTSPPYGPTVHGQVRPGPDGLRKSDHRYTDQPDRGNLAHRNLAGLCDGFTTILAGCAQLLRPGGTVVVTARPWRKHGQLVDLPSAVLTAGVAVRARAGRTLRGAARSTARRTADTPAQLLPAPPDPPRPHRRHPPAPDRPRGRPGPTPFEKGVSRHEMGCRASMKG
jgi:hypothetical protein